LLALLLGPPGIPRSTICGRPKNHVLETLVQTVIGTVADQSFCQAALRTEQQREDLRDCAGLVSDLRTWGVQCMGGPNVTKPHKIVGFGAMDLSRFGLDSLRAPNRSPTPISKSNDVLGQPDDIWGPGAPISGRFWGSRGPPRLKAHILF
jgi:hypothetical protein